MKICESVEALAAALAAHVRKAELKDPLLVVYLAEIGTMPIWREMGMLDHWEERVNEHPIDRATRKRMQEPLSNLAEEIFELGRSNLYAAVNPTRTKAEFERVRRLLLDAGVASVPRSADFDFTDW